MTAFVELNVNNDYKYGVYTVLYNTTLYNYYSLCEKFSTQHKITVSIIRVNNIFT